MVNYISVLLGYFNPQRRSDDLFKRVLKDSDRDPENARCMQNVDRMVYMLRENGIDGGQFGILCIAAADDSPSIIQTNRGLRVYDYHLGLVVKI